MKSSARKKSKIISRLDDLISGPVNVQDDLRVRLKSRSCEDLKCDENNESSKDLCKTPQVIRFRDAFKWRNKRSEKPELETTSRFEKPELSHPENNVNDQPEDNEDNEKADQNLEFKGEIVISKQGEVSYLGKFLFNLPEQLDEKPLQLILETTNSLNDQMTGGPNEPVRPSLSNDLDHEPTEANQAYSPCLAE